MQLHRDLSKVDNSVTHWLETNIEEINSIYKEKDKLINKLNKMQGDVKVSKEWFRKFINRIKNNNNEQNIKYIYNVYLKGCCLSTESNINEDN